MDTVSGYQIAVQQEHMIIMILMTVAVVWAVKFFGELIKKEIMIFKLGKSTGKRYFAKEGTDFRSGVEDRKSFHNLFCSHVCFKHSLSSYGYSISI